MDYNKIKEAAQNYEADMTKFLRELVHFPGESCGEKDHVMRIKEEMEKLGFDKVEIDQWEISLAIWELEALSSVSTDILIL